MKRVIPCKYCANCAVIQPAGFTATEELYCEVFGGSVTDQDGCTKGTKGRPHVATIYPFANIKDQAAVYGYWGWC